MSVTNDGRSPFVVVVLGIVDDDVLAATAVEGTDTVVEGETGVDNGMLELGISVVVVASRVADERPPPHPAKPTASTKATSLVTRCRIRRLLRSHNFICPSSLQDRRMLQFVRTPHPRGTPCRPREYPQAKASACQQG
jgi:hypothetical protein